MVQIRFIRQGANSVIGGFASGDIKRVSAEFAAHLVDEAQVAEYVQTKAEPEPRRTRKAKS